MHKQITNHPTQGGRREKDLYTPHHHFIDLLLSTMLPLYFGGKKDMERTVREKCQFFTLYLQKE